MAYSAVFDRFTQTVFTTVETLYLPRTVCKANQDTINFIAALQKQPNGRLYDLTNTLLVIVKDMDKGKLVWAEQRALARTFKTSERIIWEVYHHLFVPLGALIGQVAVDVFDTYSDNDMQQVLRDIYRSQASGVSTKPGQRFQFYVAELVGQMMINRIISYGFGQLIVTWSQNSSIKVPRQTTVSARKVAPRSNRPAFDKITNNVLVALTSSLAKEKCYASQPIVDFVRALGAQYPEQLHLLLVRLYTLNDGWNYNRDAISKPDALRRISSSVRLTPHSTGQIYESVVGGLVGSMRIDFTEEQLTQAIVELYRSSQEIVRHELTGENYQFMNGLLQEAIATHIIKRSAGHLVSMWLHIPTKR